MGGLPRQISWMLGACVALWFAGPDHAQAQGDYTITTTSTSEVLGGITVTLSSPTTAYTQRASGAVAGYHLSDGNTDEEITFAFSPSVSVVYLEVAGVSYGSSWQEEVEVEINGVAHTIQASDVTSLSGDTLSVVAGRVRSAGGSGHGRIVVMSGLISSLTVRNDVILGSPNGTIVAPSFDGQICGDSMREGSEDCDPGTETNTCDGDCTFVMCGDGHVNLAVPEQCDDAGESLMCDDDCTVVECGDSTVNETAGEECDDGVESATCDADCSAADCGDGTLNMRAGETCDDGNLIDDDECNNSCELASCGDSIVQPATENCDDGNSSNEDDCLNSCQLAECGDGFVRAGFETCDDGNQESLDGCSALCELEGDVDAGTITVDSGIVVPTPDGGVLSADGGSMPMFGRGGRRGGCAVSHPGGGSWPLALGGVLIVGLVAARRRSVR